MGINGFGIMGSQNNYVEVSNENVDNMQTQLDNVSRGWKLKGVIKRTSWGPKTSQCT